MYSHAFGNLADYDGLSGDVGYDRSHGDQELDCTATLDGRLGVGTGGSNIVSR